MSHEVPPQRGARLDAAEPDGTEPGSTASDPARPDAVPDTAPDTVEGTVPATLPAAVLTGSEDDAPPPPVPGRVVRTGRALRRFAQRLRRARWVHWFGVLLVAVVGSAIGAALAPPVTTQVGPLQLQVRVLPSLSPGVHLLLPPAGVVTFDTHLAPIAIDASISEVDLVGARQLIESPRGLATLERQAPDQLRSAVLASAALTCGFALAGAVGLSLLVYRRRWRRTAQVSGTLAAVLLGVTAVGGLTFDSDKLAQPQFTGLLSQAPYLAGQADSLARRLESYRAGLADIVQGVTTLYGMSGQLPVVPQGANPEDVVTLLHVSDIHLNPLAFDLIDRLVTQFTVDAVVDTGDITSWGTEVESSTLSRIGKVPVPYVFVRGNHDSRRTQAAVAQNKNAIVLDGGTAVVKGLVIAGIGDPRFTPDAGASGQPAASAQAAPGTGRAAPSGSPSSTVDAVADTAAATPSSAGPSSGTLSAGTSSAATDGPSDAPSDGPSASASPGSGAIAPRPDPEVRAGNQLADVIRQWNARHTDRPVDIALIHEPYAVRPLLGTVPLVLAGHFHKRSVELDASGTRVMVEGSTGGAGVSADFKAIGDGDPVPLSATLIYVARTGARAGEVLAYDQVTVGGFGLASASLERTVVRAGTVPVPRAGIEPSLTPTPAPVPNPTPTPTPSPVPPSTPPAAPSTTSPTARPT